MPAIPRGDGVLSPCILHPTQHFGCDIKHVPYLVFGTPDLWVPVPPVGKPIAQRHDTFKLSNGPSRLRIDLDPDVQDVLFQPDLSGSFASNLAESTENRGLGFTFRDVFKGQT